MTSSKVSSTLLFLLLLVLVFQHIDAALGEPIQLNNRKLKETEHHDQTAGQRRVLMGFDPKKAADAIRKGAKIIKGITKVFTPPPAA